jgi:radical SAM protein with 4Fe4S-binding SPASM domain
MGTQRVTLIGEGEPFLHPSLFDLIAIAKDAGFQVLLFTNGTFLNEANCRALLDSGLDLLRVGLWVSSPEEYEETYPASGRNHFRTIVEGLKLLSRLKAEMRARAPEVILSHPLNRKNHQTIDDFVDLALDASCDVIYFSPFINRKGKLSSYVLTPEEETEVCRSLKATQKRLSRLSIKHNIHDMLLRYGLGEDGWKRQPCYIGWFHAQIKPDGTILPCNRSDLLMGNLHDNSFHEIWNNDGYRTFRRTTLTRKGLASLSGPCDCTFCPHPLVNIGFHRKFKWLSPFCRGLHQAGLTSRRKLQLEM